MTNRIDFKAISQAALPLVIPMLRRWLPDGSLNGSEYVARNPTRSDRNAGSFKINISTGQWADFATGDQGGDLVSLGAYLAGCTQSEAALGIADMISSERKVDAVGPCANPMFAWLTPEERNAPPPPSGWNCPSWQDGRGHWQPVSEVPSNAPEPDFFHPAYPESSRTWPYHSSTGALLGYVVRFEPPGERKQVLPHTYCENEHGERSWQWKGFARPTPLYGLDRLASRPDAPVIVAEGEKAADAAAALFPDHVATTSQGGSGSAHKADWRPLVGREVAIWPDNDDAGRDYADEVARLARAAGAISVNIVEVPVRFPNGWDLADPLPDGFEADVLERLLQTARPATRTGAPPVEAPRTGTPPHPTHGPYVNTSEGVFCINPDAPDARPQFVCGSIEILAETRDTDGQSWGVHVGWKDRDGTAHDSTIPRSDLASDGVEVVARLMGGGLEVATGRRARERFIDFLNRSRSDTRARCVSRIGWHGNTFVLPDRTFGASAGEQVVFQTSGSFSHSYNTKGSLQGWQQKIAELARGNSRLILSISAAFAAPLLHLTGTESGGLHLRGGSSIGKSTALFVGGSVWGGDPLSGYVSTWRATDNGLEGVAYSHCDTLLCLDELSQVDARAAGAAAYMLGNSAGKTRATRNGENRAPLRFRCLYLSSGEMSLADKIAEDGRNTRVAAGQQVRVIDIPADAGAGLGLFECLHGYASGDALARHLKSASAEQYGWAGRAIVEALATTQREEFVRTAQTRTREFVDRNCPPGADGQVVRVAARFGLVAAGGEIAASLGIVPWPEGEATEAVSKCFGAWLETRGGLEPSEITEGVHKVLGSLQAHGSSRFELWADLPGLAGAVPNDRTQNRLGWRRKNAKDKWEYYVASSGFREMTQGFDHRLIAAALVQKGYLAPGGNGRASKSISVPGYHKQRLYHFVRINEGEREEYEESVPSPPGDEWS